MLTKTRVTIRLMAVTWLCLCSYAFAQTSVPQEQLKPAARPSRPGIALVTVERYGGYAGVHDRYDIYLDGRVFSIEGDVRQVSPQEVAAIQKRIKALDLPRSCQVVYQAGLCSDCFRYRITLFDAAGNRALTLEEPQLGGQDTVSKLAKDLRDLVSGLKWK